MMSLILNEMEYTLQEDQEKDSSSLNECNSKDIFIGLFMGKARNPQQSNDCSVMRQGVHAS